MLQWRWVNAILNKTAPFNHKPKSIEVLESQMTPGIKNRQELLSSGDGSSRALVLNVAEETLGEMNAYKRLKQFVSMDGSLFRVGKLEWDLAKKRHVYLICGGKAANATCMALEEILGAYLTKGVVIVKSLEAQDRFDKCKVFVGGHPLPNMQGYHGCLEILKMVEQANENDLFISAISGGTSAMMSCPVKDLTLEEEILTTDVMLKSGANIYEINSIRRHISRINGGNLAKSIEETGAEMILLMHKDGVGYPPTIDPGIPDLVIGGPMAPDNTTLQDAQNTIRNYDLAKKLPRRVVEFFENCTQADETPKKLKRFTSFVVNTLPDLCLCAKRIADGMRIPATILTSSLTGSGKDMGTFFAAIAREVHLTGNPVIAPHMFIASGEVNTVIDDPRSILGLGGPGQEMAASFAIAARDIPGACLLSIDSEGTDGPTDAAGGLVDSLTYALAQSKGIDLYKALRHHATYQALGGLGCRVVTGNTGTTLCDLHILYVPRRIRK